jgi:hypothetical protein
MVGMTEIMSNLLGTAAVIVGFAVAVYLLFGLGK